MVVTFTPTISVCKSWETVLDKSDRAGGPSPWGNSKWGDFRDCPYLFWWKHVKRMKRDEPEEPLEIGGLYHELLARYYKFFLRNEDTLSGDDLDKGCIGYARELLEKTDKITPYISSQARNLFDSWLVKYGPGMPLDDRETTYDVETLIEVEEPFHYSARIDRWVMTDFGPVIIEAKSAKARTTYLLQSYPIDPQFIGQVWLWRKKMSKKYGKLHGFVVDLATKTNPVGLYRESALVSDEVIRRWEKDMVRLNLNMHRCRVEKFWPKHYGYQCRFCPLLNHCQSSGKNTVGWKRKERGDY